MRRAPRAALLVVPILALGACSGDDDGGITNPTGTISVTLGTTTITLAQGQSNTVLVSVTRSDGFDGAVALSVTGAPSGVTGTFSPASVASGSTSSTLTLSVSASAATGSHALTVHASAAGIAEKTATLTLVVNAPPSYALSLDPASMSLQEGGSGQATIQIVRTNFTGAVELSVSGAPVGVTATVAPASATGATAVLTVDAGAGSQPGDYTLTVTGATQDLDDRTAALALTIAAGQLALQTPAAQAAPVGQPFSLQLDASGPGTLTFTSVGTPLPEGVTLSPATGEIAGTPSIAALLSGSPAGVSSGVVIRVTNGTDSAETAPFELAVIGAALPTPYAYMPFDGSDLGDAFGRAGTAMGTVTPGQPGALGESVRVSGTNSRIKYPISLGSVLNGKAGVTVTATISTTSSGTMFFGLSDQTEFYSRVYAGLLNGRFEFGGRSQRRENESYQGLVGTSTVNDGQFHTLVGTMDLPQDRIAVYVDGVLDASTAVGFGLDAFESITPADENIVGHNSGYADSNVAPNIRDDEVALWDMVLTPEQIATLRWLILSGTTIQEWIGF